jgi:hypothetical protein
MRETGSIEIRSCGGVTKASQQQCMSRGKLTSRKSIKYVSMLLGLTHTRYYMYSSLRLPKIGIT